MNIELNDIISPEFQKEIQDSLAFATGFGVVFIDRMGRHIGDGGNFCRFCRAINNTEEGRRACEESNRRGVEEALATNESKIFLCHAGLVSFVVPMFYNREYIGAITAGQIACDEMEKYPQYSSSPQNWKDNPELYKYHDEIRKYSHHQVEGAVAAFRNISNYVVRTVAYNKIKQELLETQTKQLQLENQLKIAELNALQKQVTPHFIFNVLSGITRLLDDGQCEDARQMLASFTRMMRYALYDATTVVTLQQELDYIRNYLEIQQIRFGSRINFTISCHEQLQSLRLPFFALQPLVENAIQHGILPRDGGGTLRIACTVQNDTSIIRIEDDGIGMSPEQLAECVKFTDRCIACPSTGHVGLYNSSRRFYHMYEGRALFKLSSIQNKGTCVEISIADKP